MLTQYITQTQQLLQNPPAPTSLYPVSSLTSWINTARGQLAGESESIRFIASIPTVIGQQTYPFTSISLTLATGVQGVINVRNMWYGLNKGQKWVRPRGFEWFSLYELNTVNPQSGPPAIWSQYGQGVSGSFYVSPLPDAVYTLYLDCVCYPQALVTDATPEAIPYLWTDAVPFFAAWYALLAAQSAARQADADRMFQRYQDFVNRARRFSTPSTLPGLYPQAPNPLLPAQLGLTPKAGDG